MPETIIWSLLAVVIFSNANANIKTEGDYFLSWGSKTIGYKKFLVKNSWGKEKV